MTNEEAIEILKAENDLEDGEVMLFDPYGEAIKMAIKALEQEPKPCDTCRHYENGCHWLPSVTPLEQEPCEDAISRQAVLEQINCWIGSGEYRFAMGERFLIDRIKQLPLLESYKEGSEGKECFIQERKFTTH